MRTCPNVPGAGRHFLVARDGASLLRMTKIKIGDPSKVRAGRKVAIGRAGKRVRDEQGQVVTMYTLDANSESVGDEVLALFKRNVTRARRAHRDLVKKHRVAAE